MQQVIGVVPPVQFDTAAAAYREKMTAYPRNLPGSATLAALAASNGNYMLVGPDCHFWSCLFLRPQVAQPGFRKMASVVLLRDNLTGRPTPNLRDNPRLLSVFAHRTEAGTTVGTRPGAPVIERSANVGFIRYPAGQAPQAPSRDAWQKASAADKADLLRRFLEDCGWFGVPPSDAARRRIVEDMVPRIDVSFGPPEIAALDAAFDHALTDPRAWDAFQVYDRRANSTHAQ